MEISTRAALADDKPALWHLYENALKQHIEAIWGWDADWQAAYFDKALSSSSTYVVEVDGLFAGYLQIDLGEVGNYLSMFVLGPAFRSRGVGAKLLIEIVRASCHRGRALNLRVFRTNLAAKRFYEREGWRVAGADGDFFLMEHEMRPAAFAIGSARAQDAGDFEITAAI